MTPEQKENRRQFIESTLIVIGCLTFICAVVVGNIISDWSSTCETTTHSATVTKVWTESRWYGSRVAYFASAEGSVYEISQHEFALLHDGDVVPVSVRTCSNGKRNTTVSWTEVMTPTSQVQP